MVYQTTFSFPATQNIHGLENVFKYTTWRGGETDKTNRLKNVEGGAVAKFRKGPNGIKEGRESGGGET